MSLMAAERVQPALPRKVIQTAATLGVHNDCILSERPCARCAPLIIQAMDVHYGHLDTAHEVILAVMSDFAEEENNGR